MKKVFLIIYILCSCGILSAQEKLSMQEVEQAIQTGHPAIKVLDASAKSMNAAAEGAFYRMPTELGVGFFQTPYDPRRWKAQNGQAGMGSVMLSAQQMFANKKTQQANYDYMIAHSSVEKQQKEVVAQNLLSEARKNYYDLIIVEKKLSVLEENAKLLKFMMQSAEIRYKNGIGKISAYYKAQAALAKVESAQLDLQNEKETKSIAINTLMNRNTNFQFLVDTNYNWINFSQAMLDTAALVANRSDIKVLSNSMELNTLQQKAELAKLRPEFGVQYNHMMGWAGQPFMFTAMGMVRIPIGQSASKMNRANAESLLIKNEALKEQQESIVNEITGKANADLATLKSKRKQMQLYEKQVIPALQKNFQTMLLAYEQNTGELFELFDAWEALNMTQLDYLDQLQTALAMQSELIRLLEIKD